MCALHIESSVAKDGFVPMQVFQCCWRRFWQVKNPKWYFEGALGWKTVGVGNYHDRNAGTYSFEQDRGPGHEPRSFRLQSQRSTSEPWHLRLGTTKWGILQRFRVRWRAFGCGRNAYPWSSPFLEISVKFHSIVLRFTVSYSTKGWKNPFILLLRLSVLSFTW